MNRFVGFMGLPGNLFDKLIIHSLIHIFKAIVISHTHANTICDANGSEWLSTYPCDKLRQEINLVAIYHLSYLKVTNFRIYFIHWTNFIL